MPHLIAKVNILERGDGMSRHIAAGESFSVATDADAKALIAAGEAEPVPAAPAKGEKK